jgi:hypothetical protein
LCPDRQPYLTTIRTGKPSIIPADRHIHHNLVLATYNTVSAVDTDDGSAYYVVYDNVFAYGAVALKSGYGGHDNRWSGNLLAFVGACRVPWLPRFPGYNDAFEHNHCITLAPGYQSDCGVTVGWRVSNNSVLVKGGVAMVTCGDYQKPACCTNTSLAAWVAAGHDPGSSGAEWPDAATLTEWAQRLLSSTGSAPAMVPSRNDSVNWKVDGGRASSTRAVRPPTMQHPRQKSDDMPAPVIGFGAATNLITNANSEQATSSDSRDHEKIVPLPGRRLAIYQGALQALGSTPEVVAEAHGEAGVFVLSHVKTLDFHNGCLDAAYPGGMSRLIDAIRLRSPNATMYGYVADTADAPSGTVCGQSPAAANWSCPASGCPNFAHCMRTWEPLGSSRPDGIPLFLNVNFMETYAAALSPATKVPVELQGANGETHPAFTPFAPAAASNGGKVITILPPCSGHLEELGLLEWPVSELAHDVMPFRVVRGSAEMILARTTTGWRITLVNNLGITKECSYAAAWPHGGCTDDKLDATQRQTIEIAWDSRYGALKIARELVVTGTVLPIPSGTSMTVRVRAGEVRVLGLVLAKPPIKSDDDHLLSTASRLTDDNAVPTVLATGVTTSRRQRVELARVASEPSSLQHQRIHAAASSSSSVELTWAATAWVTTSVQIQYDAEWMTVGVLPAPRAQVFVGGLLDATSHSMRICNGTIGPPPPPRPGNYTGNCSTLDVLHGFGLGRCATILEHVHHTAPSATACCERCTKYDPAWGSCGAWSWDTSKENGDCELYGSSDCVRIPKNTSISGIMQKLPGPSPAPPVGPNQLCSEAAVVVTPAADKAPRGIAIQTSNATFPRSGEGTVVRDGEKLFYFYGRWLKGQGGDLGESVIVYKTSDDNGASWSDDAVQLTLADGKGRANIGAVVLAPGHILISYFVSVNKTAIRVTRQTTGQSTDHGGLAFGPEKIMSDGSYDYMTGAHDRLRQLSNGRLLITIHVKISGRKDGQLCTLVFYSDTQGETWKRTPICLNLTNTKPYRGSRSDGFLESAFVELGTTAALQGHLLMLGRSSTGWLGQTRSSNFGSTWSDVVLNKQIRHPEAPPNLARLPDGRLLLVTEPHFAPDEEMGGTRYILAVQTSSDGGDTWQRYRNLQFTGEDVHEHSYCSIFVDGDRVHFTHYRACAELPCHGVNGFRSAQYVQLNASFFSDEGGGYVPAISFKSDDHPSLRWQQQPPLLGRVSEYDLTYLQHLPLTEAWEHLHAVVAIAGIVNRDGPKLFTPYDAPDTHADARWRSYLTKPGQWLRNVSFVSIASCQKGCIEQLVDTFHASLRGAVVYDPAVPATSNIASTVAGVESVVPVLANGTLYTPLVVSGLLPVIENLQGKFTGAQSGSAKCDAYLWAADTYLKTGRANASFLPNYVDAWVTTQSHTFDAPRNINLTLSTTMLTNHDYFIAQKGFFWDLAVFPDEAPSDDPRSPLGLDRRTVETILGAAYNQTGGTSMIKVAGQGPHVWKYSSEGVCGKKCKHATVSNEVEMVSLFTSFNAYNDADDVELTKNGVSDGSTLGGLLGMIANSQFYSHHPLPDKLTQHPAPSLDSLRAKGYIDAAGKVVPKAYESFYHGDWDGAAWIYNYFDLCWNDPARGSVPLMVINWMGFRQRDLTTLPPCFCTCVLNRKRE